MGSRKYRRTQTIRTKVAGVTFGTAQKTLAAHSDDTINFRLVREPKNRADANAIRVELHGKPVGHVPAEIAAELAPAWDSGSSVCWVERGEVHSFAGDSGEIWMAYIDIVEETVEDGKLSRQSHSMGSSRFAKDCLVTTFLAWLLIFIGFMAIRWLMSGPGPSFFEPAEMSCK